MANAKLRTVVDVDFDRSSQEAETRNFHDAVKFYAKAKEMGFYSLNSAEKQLIDLLRRTNYHGRNVVIDVAQAMRKSHPWVDDPGACNTVTTYPARGCFFHISEG